MSCALQIATSADILKDYTKAAMYFEQLVQTYDRLFPAYSFQYAEILMKAATRGLLAGNSSLRSAPNGSNHFHSSTLKYFSKALDIIRVITGTDGPTYAYYKKFYDDCREVCHVSL